MLLTRYYTILNLFVLTVVIYSSVDIFYTIAGSKLAGIKAPKIKTEQSNGTTKAEKRRPFRDYLEAVKTNLFGVVEQEPVDTSSDMDIEDLERTKLKLSLLGTVSGDRRNATAVIQEKGKRTQALYKVGDTILNATIVEILRGKIVLKVGDENQILTMEENKKKSTSSRSAARQSPRGSRSQPSAGETKITLSKSTVAKSLENMTELFSQVRVRPHYKSGKADGLMLSQVKPNTLVSKMGLRNGDVIQSVNGELLSSPEDIMDLYEDLRSGSSVSIDIMRRGRKKTMTYSFR